MNSNKGVKINNNRENRAKEQMQQRRCVEHSETMREITVAAANRIESDKGYPLSIELVLYLDGGMAH